MSYSNRHIQQEGLSPEITLDKSPDHFCLRIFDFLDSCNDLTEGGPFPRMFVLDCERTQAVSGLTSILDGRPLRMCEIGCGCTTVPVLC